MPRGFRTCLVGLTLVATLAACKPDLEKAPANKAHSAGTTAVAPPPMPDAPANPALDGTSEVARYLASDPTKGVFVATNRGILDKALASFGDSRSETLTYGVAYQKLESVEGRVQPVKSSLTFDGARKVEFDQALGRFYQGAKTYPNQVVLFVHGYNQKPYDAMSAAISVRSLLRLDAPMILFMWPSQGVVRDYPKDQAMAEASRRAFLALLCDTKTKFPDAKVTIIAHSMGNYLVANALDHLDGQGGCPTAGKISNLVMMSPDIPNEKMRELFQPLVRRVDLVTAYVSQLDRAVQSSEAFWNIDNFGFVRNGEPTVYEGIASIDVSSVQDINFSALSLNHDSYSYSQVMDDVYDMLVDGSRDPERRSLRTRGKSTKSGGRFYVMDGRPKGN